MIFNKKIIFLDIDGVLRTHKSDLEWSNKLVTPIFKGVDRLFDKTLVDNLNEVIYLTGAKIVITSNWRIYLSLEELQRIFKERDQSLYSIPCNSQYRTVRRIYL